MMENSVQIIQRFSSYIRLGEQKHSKYTVPAFVQDRIFQALISSIVQQQAQHPSQSRDTEYWGRYFLYEHYNSAQVVSIFHRWNLLGTVLSQYLFYLWICEQFLFFYLQPICWQISQELARQLSRSSNQLNGYSFEDYFILACEISLCPWKVLRRFNLESTKSLEVFARVVLQRMTKNKIVREVKNKSLKFTGYGLLKNTSLTTIESALVQYGISLPKIAQHKLACQSLKDYLDFELKASGRNHRSGRIKLELTDFRAIAQRFNEQNHRLGPNVISVDETIIKALLEQAIQSIQFWSNRQTLSLDGLVHESIEVNSLVDQIFDQSSPTYESTSASQVILTQAMESLSNFEQSLLLLWLGLEINQADFIQLLKLEKQYQVARQFQRYQRILLRRIIEVQCSRADNQRIPPLNTTQFCKEQLAHIKDYLKVDSQQKLSIWLEWVAFNHLEQSERNFLQQGCLRILSDNTLTRDQSYLRLSQIPVFEKLEVLFDHHIEIQIDINLKQFTSAKSRIQSFILNWLINNQAILQGGL